MTQISELLRVVRGESDPVPDDETTGAVTDDTTGERPSARVYQLRGERMSYGEQVQGALRHAWRASLLRGRELLRRDKGLLHTLRTGRPPSIEEHLAYGHSRAWVEPGHDGGIFDRGGVAWNRRPGLIGVAFGNWISATSHKPLRAWLTLTVGWILAALAAWLLGFAGVAAWMGAGLAGVYGLMAVVVLLDAARRPAARPEPEAKDDEADDGDWDGEAS